MKHKNLFRLFFISLLLSTFWSSCMDDPLDCGQPGMDTPAGKLAAMREYFESTSPALRQVSLGSSARSRVSSSPWSSYDLSPNWDKARVWESYKKTYVEVPLKGDGVFRSSIIGSGRRNKSYPARSFLILTLDNVTEDIHYHVATTVLETRGRTKPKEEDFQYVGNAGFNGFLIFSSVSGSFLKGFHIHGGKSHLIYIGSPRAATRSSEPSSRSYHLMLTPSVVRYSYDESGGGGGIQSGNYKYCQNCWRLYNVDKNSECPYCGGGSGGGNSGGDSGGDSGGGSSGGGETGGPIYCPFCNQPYDITLGSCPNGCEVEITPPEGDLVYCEICGVVYDTGRYRSCPNGCEVFYCDVCGKFPCICFNDACERCGSITCPGPWFCSERECTGEKCKVCGGYKASTRSGSDCPVCTCEENPDMDEALKSKVKFSVNSSKITMLQPYGLKVGLLDRLQTTKIEYWIKWEDMVDTDQGWLLQEGNSLKCDVSAIRPGCFKVFAVVTLSDNTVITTDLKDIEIRYPHADKDIANSPVVKAKMEEVWQATKNAMTTTHRQEKGCWIYLNTLTGQYEFGDIDNGPLVENNGKDGGHISPSVPKKVKQSESPLEHGYYRVAYFHTHTPWKNCPENSRRPVGPSDKDREWGRDSKNAPLFVYDYKGKYNSEEGTYLLWGNHELNDPAEVVYVGIDRCRTPRSAYEY